MMGFKLKKPARSKRRKHKQVKRRQYIRYAIFGLLSYIIFLIATLPASFVVSFIQNNPQLNRQLQMTAVNGTIWSGNAASVQIAGINLGQLDWKLNVLPLVFGELNAYIKFSNQAVTTNKISGSGNLAVSFSGDIKVNNFTAAFSADSVAPLMYGMPARFSGDINMHIDSLVLEKGKRINLKSRIVISKAGLVSPQRIEYGDILIQASPKLLGTQLVLADQGGPLILDGNIKIEGNGVYNIRLAMGARNSASADLRTGLRFLGQRDATGKYRYKMRGKLRNW